MHSLWERACSRIGSDTTNLRFDRGHSAKDPPPETTAPPLPIRPGHSRSGAPSTAPGPVLAGLRATSADAHLSRPDPPGNAPAPARRGGAGVASGPTGVGRQTPASPSDAANCHADVADARRAVSRP